MIKNNQKGFTLVELLVVMAIIALLIGIAVAGLNIARQNQRDTTRRSILSDIQNGLATLYENTGQYPPSNYAETTGIPPACPPGPTASNGWSSIPSALSFSNGGINAANNQIYLVVYDIPTSSYVYKEIDETANIGTLTVGYPEPNTFCGGARCSSTIESNSQRMNWCYYSPNPQEYCLGVSLESSSGDINHPGGLELSGGNPAATSLEC